MEVWATVPSTVQEVLALSPLKVEGRFLNVGCWGLILGHDEECCWDSFDFLSLPITQHWLVRYWIRMVSREMKSSLRPYGSFHLYSHRRCSPWVQLPPNVLPLLGWPIKGWIVMTSGPGRSQGESRWCLVGLIAPCQVGPISLLGGKKKEDFTNKSKRTLI